MPALSSTAPAPSPALSGISQPSPASPPLLFALSSNPRRTRLTPASPHPRIRSSSVSNASLRRPCTRIAPPAPSAAPAHQLLAADTRSRIAVARERPRRPARILRCALARTAHRRHARALVSSRRRPPLLPRLNRAPLSLAKARVDPPASFAARAPQSRTVAASACPHRPTPVLRRRPRVPFSRLTRILLPPVPWPAPSNPLGRAPAAPPLSSVFESARAPQLQ